MILKVRQNITHEKLKWWFISDIRRFSHQIYTAEEYRNIDWDLSILDLAKLDLTKLLSTEELEYFEVFSCIMKDYSEFIIGVELSNIIFVCNDEGKTIDKI